MRPCKLCDEMTEETELVERELDEWLLEVVLKDHPDWKQSDGTCPKCWEALQKMKSEADKLRIN